ncbi:MAG TPA: chemotaxis protein CheX [Blastocatellia bacterium]|nr:chemotaxis protein CheX [Blastocatellia bacterium]
MQFLEVEIRQITEWIWFSMLEREIRHGNYFGKMTAEDCMLTGCVRISGDWDGAVTLHCSSAFARRVAALMFDIPEQNATFEHEQDALGELVNMVGGNIKSLLPAPSHLSLPAVKHGVAHTAFLSAGKVVSKIDFEYMGEPFSVSLLKNEEH